MPHSPRDATPAPSDSTHPPPTSALVDPSPPVSSTGVTEAFTGDSSPQGEKEKPAGTWVANLAQREEGQGTSMESRPPNSDTEGGDVQHVRHQAPSTSANVEGGGEAQASCTREHQNPGTALPCPLSPEVGSAEWVLGHYSFMELAALTARAAVIEWKQQADVYNRCLAELDVYKVITIRMIFDIGMFNTPPKTKARLLAWKRCEITTAAEF